MIFRRLSPSTRRIGRGVVVATIVTAIAWVSIPLPDPPFPEDSGSVVLDAQGEVLHTYLAEDEQWRFRLEVGGFSDKLETAVVMAEDRRFRSHPGVDVLSLARAMIQNLRAGEVRSGASTLTMQVARLMRPKPRTIPNKVLEMLQAFKLESRYSKDELLRLYLEHAPYGGNVVGATAAGLHYFGRPPTRLTWAEAATLAVLPRSPTKVTPYRNAELLLDRRNEVAMAKLVEVLPDLVGRTAIFYGAAHMEDLEQRLLDMGWVRTGGRWLRAWALRPPVR
mgnify:CR=1 FL=1